MRVVELRGDMAASYGGGQVAATRSRRTDASADARPFGADKPRGCSLVCAAAVRPRLVDFPAFLCRIRGFPAMPWPDIRVADTRVRVYRLPV